MLRARLARLSLPWRALGSVASISTLILIHSVIAQWLWWWLQGNRNNDIGWKLGFAYGLFCVFLCGASVLSAWIETPHYIARRLEAVPMQNLKDAGAKTAFNVLNELTQLKPYQRPQLFLIPAREINAFSYCIRKTSNCEQEAIFITRGALNQLNRDRLKILISRQLIQLQHPSIVYSTVLCLMASGLASIFFSGMKLLSYANFGYFERRPDKLHGHPFYFIGLLPALLGLPGWWSARLALYWLDPQDIIQVDSQTATSPELAHSLLEILNLIPKFPYDDMPAASWLMRTRGLHNEGLLEQILPLQPTLEERKLQLLKKLITK